MQSIEGLMEFYNSQHDEVKTEGSFWYRNWSLKLAAEAGTLGVGADRFIGLFAVLSPGTKLYQNLIDARSVVKYGRDYKPTTYAVGREKAYAMVEGVSFERLVDPCSSPKVWNFRANLVDPDNPIPVTVDRWIARQHRGNMRVTPAQYLKIAADYRIAAKELNILPNQLQATVWVAARQTTEVPF